MSENIADPGSADDERAHEHARLLELLYRTPIGILECAANGEIRLLNPVAARIMQEFDTANHSMDVLGLIYAHAPDVRETLAKSATSSDVCRDRRLEIVRPNKQPMSLDVTIVRIDEDTLLVTLHDATRMAEAERVAREALVREAMQPNRLKVADGVLHDMRNELEAQRNELEARILDLDASRAESARLFLAVQDLAAPILTVHRGVILVPIAGALDPGLLPHAEERVLSSVAAAGARAVILDITGAKVIEVAVAEGLVRLSRAVSLLGARVVLCGVSPAAARTAVEQGLDFAPALLRRDLSSAIDAALAEDRISSDKPRIK